jgi:hypothetical protein
MSNGNGDRGKRLYYQIDRSTLAWPPGRVARLLIGITHPPKLQLPAADTPGRKALYVFRSFDPVEMCSTDQKLNRPEHV